jgi:cyclopropane-fatty-acyl-phospholipid synthase
MLTAFITQQAEAGRLPDALIRLGMRGLIRRRALAIDPRGDGSGVDNAAFAAAMDRAEIAPVPALANEQHYELPPAFFGHVLGCHRKYSCCLWSDGAASLDEAEAHALARTCERAAIADGMRILELGCGWGSLTLWMAAHYPASRIWAVSNSAPQREYIEAAAAERGLGNVRVITADMNDFDIDGRFDRVVSVEMFEHMRNYRALYARIARWLEPDGRFFMHVFCHRHAAYEFVDAGPSDWMSRHFFSGGIMPSADLPLAFDGALAPEARWQWSGLEYRRTADAWLANMDARRDAIMPLLEDVYGAGEAWRWWMRWRMFFMAVSELFGYDGGRQWFVGHYRFAPGGSAASTTR